MAKCSCSTQILPACFAWGFFIGLTTVFFLFPCPFIIEEFESAGIAITIYEAVLTLLVFSHFLAATVVDPGKYPRASQDEVDKADPRLTLSRNMEIDGVSFRMKWCTSCQFYRPPRCSHCSVCDMCIDTFDHHCPWVNNCIGRRNYRYFILFLFSLWVHMISVLIFTIMAIMKWKNRHNHFLDAMPILSIVECCLVGLFLIPVTGLSTFHVYLISNGRTTNEQVTGKVQSDSNPFSKGCMNNWCYTFYGPQLPKLIGHEPKTELIKSAKLSKSLGASIDDVRVLLDNPAGDVPNSEKTTPVTPTVKVGYEDTKSVASSIILNELNVNRNLHPHPPPQQRPVNSSTNNLLRVDTSNSLTDYYIASEPQSNNAETSKLLTPVSDQHSEYVVNGTTFTGNNGNAEEETENLPDTESTSLLTAKVTSM